MSDDYEGEARARAVTGCRGTRRLETGLLRLGRAVLRDFSISEANVRPLPAVALWDALRAPGAEALGMMEACAIQRVNSVNTCEKTLTCRSTSTCTA